MGSGSAIAGGVHPFLVVTGAATIHPAWLRAGTVSRVITAALGAAGSGRSAVARPLAALLPARVI